MATGPVDIALGTPAPDFRLLATDSRTLCAQRRRRRKGNGDRLHLQSLPVREGGDRPSRARRPRPSGQGNRLRRHLLERRLKPLSGGLFPKMAEFAFKRATISRFPIFTMKARTLPAPMARSAPRLLRLRPRLENLKYRGRLDEGRTTPPPPGARRELVEAMRAIAATGVARGEQIPSIGCSIKWRAASG